MDARTLSQAMGNRLSMGRYEELVDGFNEALLAADCTTVDRVAMFCAQVGHESAGLYYMEEIASGDAYEWRSDLGNNQPGDGRRFKGSGPIQLTGRHNFGKFSQWCFDNEYTPTSTYFVDHPELVREVPKWGFLAASWYWVVARNMNSYADRNDIEGATRAVNGGLNGFQDRINYWNRAKALGGALLPDRNLLMVRFTNSEGIEVDEATYMHWTDKRVKLILEQLAGPGRLPNGDPDFKGWEQLGSRSFVDALAAVGAKLGIEGFKDPKAGE